MVTVLERVQELVAERLGVDQASVLPEASFIDDLNADSLDLVELIMAFEEEFSQDGQTLEIPDEDAEKITRVHHAVDYIKGKGVEDS